VFAIDIEVCRSCGGKLRVIASIEEHATIERILEAGCSDRFAILVTTRATVRERTGPRAWLAAGPAGISGAKGKIDRLERRGGWTGSTRMAASICLHPPGRTDSAASHKAAYTGRRLSACGHAQAVLGLFG
jgi:hypothetical protein